MSATRKTKNADKLVFAVCAGRGSVTLTVLNPKVGSGSVTVRRRFMQLMARSLIAAYDSPDR